MTKYIQVRCLKCHGFYNVRYTADLKVLGKRLDFSVCACGYIRNPKCYRPFALDKHCYGCGLPKPICEKFIGDYCSICYLHDVYYQKDHKYIKREVSLRAEIVILKLNEGTSQSAHEGEYREDAPSRLEEADQILAGQEASRHDGGEQSEMERGLSEQTLP